MLIVKNSPYLGRRGGNHAQKVKKRTHCVSVRLDDDELSELNARRGKMERASWLRAAALSSVPAIIPPLNTEGIRLLSTCSNNLNQIAHQLNQGAGFDTKQLSEALNEVQALRRLLIGAN
jgi:hypothetical protein